MKRYVPVKNFERQTSYCPTYIAWIVIDEASHHLRAPIPDTYARRLARRAEALPVRNAFWQRKYKGAKGREYLLISMRHWLSGILAKEKPALFRQLPDEFQVGRPIPVPIPPKIRPPRPVSPFPRVHGCELLAF
jgi:hypothetical protein